MPYVDGYDGCGVRRLVTKGRGEINGSSRLALDLTSIGRYGEGYDSVGSSREEEKEEEEGLRRLKINWDEFTRNETRQKGDRTR